jgi:hypothetical protein
MATSQKTLSAHADVDVDALYDRLGGVAHRESIEVEVDRALHSNREDLIDRIVSEFDERNRKAAKA